MSPTKRRIPACLLSPSKSRTSSFSPRKSPVKAVSFQSTKGVSFTPQRTKQPPRAWERRPATPFVPRDDKQKIWKRVPLGEIGVDGNRPIGISRREQEGNKDYARVVKKLKVGHDNTNGGEDKENHTVGVKLVNEENMVKTSKKRGEDFVSMKMEEDEIWGSPKKKVRPQPQEEHPEGIKDLGPEGDGPRAGQEQNIAEEVTENLSQMSQLEETDGETDVAGGVSTETTEEHELARNGGRVEVITEQGLQGDENHMETATEEHAHDILMYSVSNSTDNTKSLRNDSPVNEAQANLTDSIAISEHSSKEDRELQLARNYILPTSVVGEQAEEGDEKAQRLGMDVEETKIIHVGAASGTPEMPQWKVADALCKDASVALDEYANSDLENDLIDEPQSSSPPTILAEYVIVDELASAHSPSRQARVVSNNGEDKTTPDGQAAESVIQATQKSASKRVSDDETAFLQGFLSRTKAQRAARELELQQMVPNDLSVPQEEVDVVASDNTPISEASTERLASLPQLEAPTENQIELVSSSPLRRSKRAAVTSLPRPQTLPNAIQLKRASGSEFIFTANKTSSAANIAIATRTNTKRNKGSALSVHARLEQLLAEKAIGESDEAEKKDEEGYGEGEKDKGAKKRKRDKNDDNKKSRKALRWNDEYLVSYQEPPEKNDEWEDFDDSSRDSVKEERKEDNGSTGGTKIKLTMGSAPPGNAKSKAQDATDVAKQETLEVELPQQDQQETSPAPGNKVRRVRRGIAGSENGTPGPKTRSKRVILESDVSDAPDTTEVPAELGPAVEESAAATAAMSNLAVEESSKATTAAPATVPARRSRMPIPSARKGAAASASIRTANAASRGSAPTNKEKEEEPKRDLLGKRRLRVRT